MMRHSKSLALLCIVSSTSLSVSPALAAPPARGAAPVPVAEPAIEPAGGDDRASGLRSAGNQAMLEMRYVDALAAYRESAALAPEYTGIWYSIARAHQLLGEFAEALTSLERFEREAAPETKAKVGQLDRLFAELRARVGTLQLTCNVQGARVLLRNKVIGVTPLPPTRIEAGAAPLELELDGFFPARREIVVPAGGRLSLELELRTRSSSALLVVSTTPGGARISIDGKHEGTSSPRVELALPAGTHRVIAEREGFDSASVPFVVKPGETRNLQLELERAVPVTSRWWFWTSIGVVVAGGAALTVAMLTERKADQGTLGTLPAPLTF